MNKPEIHTQQEQPAIHLKPIISYPRIAEASEHYLLTIDVQLAENSPWPYPEEEFEISFVLKTDPFFLHEPFREDEPGLVLHRFGGTYGPAEYLLTASPQPVSTGKITIILLNAWGLSIAHLDLECEVQQQVQQKTQAIRKHQKEHLTSSFTPSSFAQLEEDEILHLEKEQRDLIAQQLTLVGWNVLSVEDITMFPDSNVFPGENAFPGVTVPPGNIALRGYPSVEHDYLLIIEQEVIGYVKVYIQGKHLPDERDNTRISDVTTEMFATLNTPLGTTHILFFYYTTGYETTFSKIFESRPFKNVYTFHQPSTLIVWLPQVSSMQKKYDNNPFSLLLLQASTLKQDTLYDYQFAALQQIEQSLSNYHPRTLIQMKTNAGKTHTAIHSIYRLITYAHAKRILYIVDVPLAQQYAYNAFQRFILPEDTRKFSDTYKVHLITDKKLDPSAHVYIGMLEDLYTLYASGEQGERLPRPASRGDSTEPMSLVKDYCATLPIEYFDAIYLAESEHINYHMWQPLLDYFDTFYIGIADSISEGVLQFFNNNLVYPASRIVDPAPQEQTTLSSSLTQQQVSNTIKNVRALLRTDEGLSDYTDQLTQLSWLLLLKYLDDFEQTEAMLNSSYIPIIDPSYRWSNWPQNLTNEALLTFVNDQLIPYLATLRGETFHDLRTLIGTIFRETYNRSLSGPILREIINLLNTINLHSSDVLQTLANEYETVLKEAHFTSRDAREYYTPRPIVRFIIDRLQPRLGEYLLDPACGTAGFLIEAFEHLNSQVLNPEQWRKLQECLIGVQKQSLPYLLGTMNMLLHGIETPNILHHNALATGIQSLRDGDYADIIVINPPFSGWERSNIAYPFSSDPGTTEIDQLFLQYCMAALKRPSGRCAILLANRLLSDTSAPAIATKRRLLTNFRLHTIVRLPSGVFAPYVGTPTTILFFEASDHPSYSEHNPCTKETWYYEIPLPTGQKRYSEKLPIQDEDFHACQIWWDQRNENEHAWRVSTEWLFAHDCNLDSKNPSHNGE
jgi:type I restriction enzyme M protein